MAEMAPPDPRRGVFETMLVVDGHPVELDAHLSRLAGSLEALFGSVPPNGIHDSVLERTAGLRLGRARLAVAPGGSGGLVAKTSAAAVDAASVFPGWEGGAGLSPVSVESGLGPHKWADRSALERTEATLAGALPLLLDRDGTVLEASRANLFTAIDGVLATPPADGRILPGIARARTIEIARTMGIDVRERRIQFADLFDADEVFVSGSVRGIEPVRSVGGVELARSEGIAARVAAQLRRDWMPGRGSANALS